MIKQQALKKKFEKWIDKKFRYFLFYLYYWEKVFYRYECNENLRGIFNARISREIYKEKVSFIRRKIRQLYLLKENKNKSKKC